MLDSAYAKLSRAEQNLDALRAAIKRFHESDPYTFAVREHEDQLGFTFHASSRIPPPVEFPMLVGEFCHNARGALDHAIYALSMWRIRAREMNSDIRRSLRLCQFPIFTDPNDYGPRVAPSLRLLTNADRTLIEAAQPFNHLRSADPLAHLAAINNQDKHRAIHIVDGQVSRGDFIDPVRIPPGSEPFHIDISTVGRSPIRHETVIFVARLNRPPPPEVDVHFHPTIDIFFDRESDGVPDLPVMETLYAIPPRVRSIIEQLEGQFV